MFKSLISRIFNLKEDLVHKISPGEIELIKNTDLFTHLDQQTFNQLIKSIRLVKYDVGKIIFREGELGDALYIISEGTVLIFIHNAEGNKIPVISLNKGDYFGEQALIGHVYNIRNANIEALTDCTLIHIGNKYIKESIRIDPTLKMKLIKQGFNELLGHLSKTNGFYEYIQSIISKITYPNVKEFTKGDVIFSAGDNPDYVYLVLEGEIELRIPDSTSSKFSSSILHKGHVFGELGVLGNKPRAATAIAHTELRLLAIIGDSFKKYVEQNPEITQIFSSLQKTYQIPLIGAVEVYLGSAADLGPTLTLIYKLEDGRSVVSSKLLNQNVFMMLVNNTESEKSYQYEGDQVWIRLYTADDRLNGIKAYGDVVELPALCRLLLENASIEKTVFSNFELTGEIKLPESLRVEKGTEQLQDAVNQGLKNQSSVTSSGKKWN